MGLHHFTVDTNEPEVLDCPSDITKTVKVGSFGTVADWKEPSAVGASGNVSLLIKTHSPGELFPIGNTTVSYVFVDASFNMATCYFAVVVIQGNFNNMPAFLVYQGIPCHCNVECLIFI